MSTLLWRPYRAQDEAGLRAAHAAQCAALGTDFAFPDLNDPHYVLIRVAERDGAIQGAVVAHATLEVMWVGGTPQMVRDAIRGRDGVLARLRALGADELHAFVPRRAVARLDRLLRRIGFRRSNENFLPYYREL